MADEERMIPHLVQLEETKYHWKRHTSLVSGET